MARVFIIAFLGIFLTTCAHRWVALPQNVPDFEKCRSLNNGPQMLRIPQFEKSYIIVHDCQAMDRQRVSIGMTIFLQEWRKASPLHILDNKKVEEALQTLIIEFSDAEKTANAYTADGTYGRNMAISGLTLSPGWAWVKIEPNERVCTTSFIHELIHVAIWAIKGTDGDPDHLGKKHTGWKNIHMLIIQNTNQRLCELGI